MTTIPGLKIHPFAAVGHKFRNQTIWRQRSPSWPSRCTASGAVHHPPPPPAQPPSFSSWVLGLAHKNFPGTRSHLALWVPSPHPQHLLIIRNSIWQAGWLQTPPALLTCSPTVEAGCTLSCWDQRGVIRKWSISLGLNEDSHRRASNYPVGGWTAAPRQRPLALLSLL